MGNAPEMAVVDPGIASMDAVTDASQSVRVGAIVISFHSSTFLLFKKIIKQDYVKIKNCI